MMNRSKKILTLVVVMCSLQVGFAQDVELTTMEQNNEIAKGMQSIEIASKNLIEISNYINEVNASLESGSLSLEEEQLNRDKLKQLTLLLQTAADYFQDLLAGVDLDKADSLAENVQKARDVAQKVYTDQVAPTLQSVFELFDNTSGAVAEGQSRGVSGEIPNIYANIGQTPVYQDVMNELHKTFRQSATTPEGGGFGETDATPN